MNKVYSHFSGSDNRATHRASVSDASPVATCLVIAGRTYTGFGVNRIIHDQGIRPFANLIYNEAVV